MSELKYISLIHMNMKNVSEKERHFAATVIKKTLYL